MTDRNDDRTIFDRLNELGNPELVRLLRLNHTTPEYRDALINEAIARLLVPAANVMPKRSLDPLWPKSQAEEDFNRRIDA